MMRGPKKRRMNPNDRNYSGGSFNLKRNAAVTPTGNPMGTIGETPVTATESDTNNSIRRLSNGLAQKFTGLFRSATVSPTRVNRGLATSLLQPTEEAPRKSSRSTQVLRRLSVSFAQLIDNALPSVPTDGIPLSSRRKSISETILGTLAQKTGPIDRFGRGHVTQTGLDASYVDEHLHVLIDGAPDSRDFALALLESVSEAFTTYMASEDFSWCTNPAQIAGEMRLKLHASIDGARTPFLDTKPAAAASVGVCIIHRPTKDTTWLHCLHIGNTKTVVVRRGDVVYESSTLMDGFARPSHVSTASSQALDELDELDTTPADHLYELVSLEAGDVVVSCTDGVTNNLYAHEIADVIQAVYKQRQASWDWVAQAIAHNASTRAEAPLNDQSPFAREAAAELYRTIDLDPELLAKYAALLRNDANLTKTALFRHTNRMVGDDFDLEQLVAWATSRTGHVDDATVIISLA
ncbi:hypothetical protein LEN26_010345 [Aphanomyces euteiches]|nr:hypothetical protein AeMF1_009429 [Aphanomyces euteiches]KAH9122187.1 hypothetical protein LEN26_010345 [Aphanomyces euteiches]